MKKIRYRIGVLSLFLSCLSLMLATLPPCILGQKIKEIEVVDSVHDAAVSLEIKGVREDFASLKDPNAKEMLAGFSDNGRKKRDWSVFHFFLWLRCS
ncbi:MAG: hypothetical protein D3922_11705 [Candidatus Electrothrix sp. AR1]|nr:hypothetical protein [Candidatus Electrothrix sp. AR1]